MDSDNIQNPLSLVKAAKYQEVETIRILLQDAEEHNVNEQDENGRTMLHFAVLEENCEIIQIAISAKINSRIRDILGESALHLAAKFGNYHITKMLLQYNPCISAKNLLGQTALHIACSNGNLDIVQYLIARGADTSTQDEKGRSALHVAAMSNHFSIIHELLEAGADVRAHDITGSTVLHYLVRVSTCVDCYEANGERIYKVQDQLNNAPQAFECIKKICECGAGPDVCVADSCGRTPIDFATKGSVIYSYIASAKIFYTHFLIIKKSLHPDLEEDDYVSVGVNKLAPQRRFTLADVTCVHVKEEFVPASQESLMYEPSVPPDSTPSSPCAQLDSLEPDWFAPL
jgi:ankyrin repeat protein